MPQGNDNVIHRQEIKIVNSSSLLNLAIIIQSSTCLSSAAPFVYLKSLFLFILLFVYLIFLTKFLPSFRFFWLR